MIRVYERSLCQSYASAYRQGIVVASTGTEEEALSIVEALTDDSYQCFALLEDGQGKTQIQNDIRRCRRTLLDLWRLIGKEL